MKIYSVKPCPTCFANEKENCRTKAGKLTKPHIKRRAVCAICKHDVVILGKELYINGLDLDGKFISCVLYFCGTYHFNEFFGRLLNAR